MIIKILLSMILGYAIGSVVMAILISKLAFKEDIRDKGSGNSGATNAARVYGLPFGVFTFAGDFLKGLLACLIGRLIGGSGVGTWAEGASVCMAFAGFFCIVGHCFPILFGLRGGKGVSVGAALALMIDWRIFLIAIGCFLLGAFLSKRVSVGSLLGAAAVGVFSIVFAPLAIVKILGAAAAVLVIYMHRRNIDRLLHGKEAAFTLGSRRPLK